MLRYFLISEAEYAFQKKKVIVPLMMERYEPDGWLGIIVGTKKFYDFSGKYPFTSRAQGLLQELQDKGKRAKINYQIQQVCSAS